MRVAIVFGSDGSDVRVGKTSRTLVKLGHEVHFVGWDRRPDEEKCAELPGVARHVMPYATPLGRSTTMAQLQFSWHVLCTLARIRPDVVCAVNEDNAFRLLPFHHLLYRRMVCDIFDSHRDRGSHRPPLIRWLLTAMSELARLGSDSLIVTDHERLSRMGRHRQKCSVVGNYPDDPGPQLAKSVVDGPTRIFASGTLIESRGIRHLLTAVEQTKDTTIISAGWLNDDFAQNTFANHPRVEFYGIVTAQKALELAAGCDAVFAYYAPTCQNNIFASPNKVYDALSVGRPVIINREARISRWIVNESLGFACDYSDAHSLREIIESLQKQRLTMATSAVRYRRLFSAQFTWEKMERRLATIYGIGQDSVPARNFEPQVA